jgi:endonuclease YncB( thermonuclease family)
MKKFANLICALLCGAVFHAHLASAAPAAQTPYVLQGLVVGVSDGDSITVLDADKRQHKIRLQGIDAPEKAQAFGQKSKESLASMVYQKTVEVHWSKKDRYGRTIGQVVLGGVDVCLAQIKRGMAWHYKAYQREQSPTNRVLYDRAQILAREQGVGLWHDPAPVEPWAFRREKRRAVAS